MQRRPFPCFDNGNSMSEMDVCLLQADLVNGNVLPSSERAMHANNEIGNDMDLNPGNACLIFKTEIPSNLTTDNGHLVYSLNMGSALPSSHGLEEEEVSAERMAYDHLDVPMAEPAQQPPIRRIPPPGRMTSSGCFGQSPSCQSGGPPAWTARVDFSSSFTPVSRGTGGLHRSLSATDMNRNNYNKPVDKSAHSDRHNAHWQYQNGFMGEKNFNDSLDLVPVDGTFPFCATSTPLCRRAHGEATSSPCLTASISPNILDLDRCLGPVGECVSGTDGTTTADDSLAFYISDDDDDGGGARENNNNSEGEIDIGTRKSLTSISQRSEISSPVAKICDGTDDEVTPTFHTPCPTTPGGKINGGSGSTQDAAEPIASNYDLPRWLRSLEDDRAKSGSHGRSCLDSARAKSPPSSEVTSSSQGVFEEEEDDSSNFAHLFRRCQIERDSGLLTPFKRAGNLAELLKSLRNGRLLCSERVSQMTKTYNDVEAVTRLLEEKERDLELAARIGQTLLSKNNELASRTESLEEQLTATNDKVCQLRYELNTKEKLLQFYSEDLENESTGDATTSEEDEKGKTFINLDALQKKVQALEDENVHLREECKEFKNATDLYEEKEKKLMEDCVKQLAEVNCQVETFSQELQHKTEENSQQKEELSLLLAQVAERQKKINQLTIDNLDLHEKLTTSTESQKKLTKELGGMQDKYDEMFEKLEEMHGELCVLRGRHKIRANSRHHHSAYSFPTDSLASELETSLQQELSQSNRRAQSWKVFETAKAAKRAIAKASSRHSASSSVQAAGSVSSQWDSDTASNMSTYASDVESTNSDGYSADMDSLYESNPELGRPGIPGSSDLESALRSLSLNHGVEKGNISANSAKSVEQEEENLRKKKSYRMEHQSPSSGSGRVSPGGASVSSSLPGCSTGSIAGSMASTQGGFKRSDKLQIVKPLEGSMTLRHWQQLATPHLGGIFEQREGVQMKGERKLELREERYSLSDFEEDDDPCETSGSDRASPGLSFTEGPEKYSGTYHGLGTLLDPRSPSPSLFSLKSSHSSSNSSKSYRASSPKLAAAAVTSSEPVQNTQPKSLGLADLLSSRENIAVGRSLMRASSLSVRKGINASSTTFSSQAGSLLNDSAVLSRSTNCLPQTSSVLNDSPEHFSSRYKNLPGSRSLEEVSVNGPGEAQMTTLSVSTAPSQNSKHFLPGMTGQGFLQQLKDRGYSLYGLWSGAGPSPSPSSSSSTDNIPKPKSSFGKAHASKATGLKQDSAICDDEDPLKVSASDILPPGTGVLGALANFRRGGIL